MFACYCLLSHLGGLVPVVTKIVYGELFCKEKPSNNCIGNYRATPIKS
jgi:hypothetical protein